MDRSGFQWIVSSHHMNAKFVIRAESVTLPAKGRDLADRHALEHAFS